MYGVGVFVVVYSVVVAVHYIVGFLLLSFVYMAILNRIRRMRTTHSESGSVRTVGGVCDMGVVRQHMRACAVTVGV